MPRNRRWTLVAVLARVSSLVPVFGGAGVAAGTDVLLGLFLTATSADAAYRCTWTDGVKACGYELGFAPSVGGDVNGGTRDKGDPSDHDGGGDGGQCGGPV